MNFLYQHLLKNNFSSDSRVWIYQCNRLFTLEEALEIEVLLENFTTDWESHGTVVHGIGYLLFGQFIVLLVDEKVNAISGCSTDSSVRFIKEIEQKFAINLFDRTSLAFIVKDKIEILPLSQFQYAMNNQFLNEDTLYFNNTIQSKKELEESWIIPVKNSWLSKKTSAKNSSLI